MADAIAKLTNATSARAKPTLSAREAPLRVLPFETMIEMTCCDCGLSRSHSCGELVNEARFGSCSMVDLERTQICTKCQGPLVLKIEGETLFSNGLAEAGDTSPMDPWGKVSSRAVGYLAPKQFAATGKRG